MLLGSSNNAAVAGANDTMASSSSSSTHSIMNEEKSNLGSNTERLNAAADDAMMEIVRAVVASPTSSIMSNSSISSVTRGKPIAISGNRRRSLGDDLAQSTIISRSDQQRRSTAAEGTRAFRSLYIAAIIPNDVTSVKEIDISVH
jgi:hypothetical protein